jgi:hypothetical protein
MKYRIAMWASLGLAVATAWAIYAFAMGPFTTQQMSDAGILLALTCPIAIAGKHFPISIYESLVANAATYALVGLFVETLRHRFSTQPISIPPTLSQ